MITIGIAEDEAIERRALERFIGENIAEAKVIWSVEDGQKALDCARSEPTDVLIIDINMPVMDGLALCETLAAEQYGGILLINTAYDRFVYAQRALRYGVSDYIIKPASNEELRTVLTNCIEKASAIQAARTDMQNKAEKAASMVQYSEAYLYDQLMAGKGVTSLLEDFGWPGGELQTYALLLETDRDATELGNRIRAFLSARYANHIAYTIHPVENRGLLLLIQPLARRTLSQWRAAIECIGYAMLHCFHEITHITASPECRQQGVLCLACRQLVASGRSHADRIVSMARDPSSLLSASERERCANSIRRHLGDGRTDHAIGLIKTIWKRKKQTEPDILWDLVALSIASTFPVCPQVLENTTWEDPLLSLRAPGNDLAREWLQRARAFFLELPSNGETSLHQVLGIMRTEFSVSLTQTSLAERIGMNPAYFSRYFKQKTGRRFIDVITEIRIQHALQLLIENPSITNEQISEACGFFSKTYFCEVFKRCVGKTTGQYKKENLRLRES